MQILSICGSVRRDSHNRRLLAAAGMALQPEVELVDADGIDTLPIFNEDEEEYQPAPVRAFLASIDAADAVLIATPEYNSSVPGGLKNALDWASRPFPENALRDKPVAVVGASTGIFGAVWAQAELRKALKASGAKVVDAELPVGQADSAFAVDGALQDPELAARLARILAELIQVSERSRPRSAVR